VKTKSSLYLWGLVASFGLYSVASYLLLLRDDFFLERFSIALAAPQFLTITRHWASITHANWLSILLLTISIIASFYFYFKIISPPIPVSLPHLSWIKWLLPLVFLALISYPGLSTDVFDYINTNRVAFIHHSNPWVTPPQNFPQDSLIYFGSWNFRASVYPPLMFAFSSLVYFVFGTSVVLSIIGFKLLNLVLWALLIYLMWRLTPSKNLWAFMAFAFNPLVLIEFLGNAHNDLTMALPIFIGFGLFYRRRYLLAGLVLGLGFLTKFTLALYLPLLIAVLFIKFSYRSIFKLISGFTITVLIGLSLLGDSASYLFANLGTQFQLYLQSLPTIIRFFLLQTLGQTHDPLAISIQKGLNLPLLALFVYFSLHSINLHRLADRSVYLMILYLTVSAPMLQPWYAIWYLPLLLFVTSIKIRHAALVFTFSLMLHYLVRNFSLYFWPNSFTWQIIIYLTMALPPLFILFAKKPWYTRVSRLFNSL